MCVIILLILICTVIPVCASADNSSEQAIDNHPYYQYKQLSIEDGIPASITSLHKDSYGSLWIGTPTGLFRYNGERIRRYHFPAPMSNDRQYVFFQSSDQQNRIWICTTEGLCHYDMREDSLKVMNRNGKPLKTRFVLPYNDRLLISAKDTLLVYDSKRLKEVNHIVMPHCLLMAAIVIGKDSILVTDNAQKIQLVDLKQGKVIKSPLPEDEKAFCMLLDSQRRLWLSHYGKGVKCFDQNYRLLHEYNSKTSAMYNDAVIQMAEWDNTIWFASDGGGLQVIWPETNRMQVFSNRLSDQFPASSIACLCPSNENIWVGTVHEGVLNIESGFMTTYMKAAWRKAAGLSAKCTLCLWEDTDGRIWIGTDGGGVNSYDQKTQKFTHYPATFNEKIVSICPLSEQELLVSCYQKGLFRFNKKSGTLTPFVLPNPTAEQEMKDVGVPVNLWTTPNGDIEMSGKVTYRYSPASRRLTRLQPNFETRSSWTPIGTYNGYNVLFDRANIFLHNPQTDEFKSIISMEAKQMLAAEVDKDGKLWVSSTEGVECHDLNKGYMEHILLPDKNDIITSLIVDNDGTVWMGSMSGIYAYNPQLKHFMLYTEMDGVMPNDFLAKPTLLSSDGNVYMGGTGGMVRINTAQVHTKKIAHVSFPIIELHQGEQISYSEPGDVIKLPYKFAPIQIHPLLQGDNIMQPRMYRFFINGVENNVTETAHPHFTVYSLAPGKYMLTAQCTLPNGTWCEEQILLKLEVSPPWWRQGWFTTLCLLFTIAVIVVCFKLHSDYIKRNLQEKERQIYKDKVRALININHELRTPLTLIYTPLKQLADSKLLPHGTRENVYKAFQQARKMKTIINMILNLRKMEMGKNILHLSTAHPNEWLKDVLDSFRDEFSLRGITLQFIPSPDVEELLFDPIQCEIIIHNLLSNAYKFSPENTTVTVTTEIENTENEKFLRIAIKDEGVGLDENDISNLFTRFYQGRYQNQGAGIGLSYAKQLIYLQGGRIGAYNNNDGPGATFFFTLPYNQKAESIASVPQAYINESLDITGGNETNTHLPTIEHRFDSVLLVDSDPDFCLYMAENLQVLFDNVYEAHDGMEVIPLLTTHVPQLIISEIKLPRMNGLELCKYIKEKPELSHLPIVLITSCVDDYNAEQAYNAGAEAFTTKPFDMNLLLTKLQNIMLNHNLIKNRYAPAVLQIAPNKSNAQEKNEQFLLSVTRIINEHLNDVDMDANFIAAEMGMSRSTLYNKLKDTMDISLNNYIQKCRIDCACKLLVQTSMSVIEISERTGFKHPRNFSTLFKNTVGVTPTVFRKNNK